MMHTQRKAFAMLMALAVIVIMSIISALVLNVSNKTVVETTMQYQREQAALLAKSYTEYAILAVTANDRTVNCIENINGGINTVAQASIGKGFRVNVNISYIGDSVANNAFATCAGTRVHFGDNATDRFGGNPSTLTPLNIIIDVYVRYKDLNHPDIPNSPWHTYHRRTLQQI